MSPTRVTHAPASPIIDMHQLLDRLGGDLPLVRELAAAFVAAFPEFMAHIRTAIEAGHASQASRAAHTLAGTLSNFAAEGPLLVVRDLERAALSGDVASLPLKFATLEREMDALLPELEKLMHEGSERGF